MLRLRRVRPQVAVEAVVLAPDAGAGQLVGSEGGANSALLRGRRRAELRRYVDRAEPKEVRRSVDARAPRADPMDARRSPPGVFSDASDVLVPPPRRPGVCFPGVVVSTEGRRVVDADDARREPVAEGRRFVMGVLGGTMSRARASLWTAAAARMHRSCAASTAASASSMLFRTASARF